VRHYRRGGAVARYLDDRYLAAGDSRPVRELKASVEARRRGVPTPAVVAGAVYTSGMFYRADIATEFIPDAESLADLLFRSSDRQIDAEKTLHISGEVVRTLEDTHVLHPDVNAGNILLREHDGVIEAHVIDLDRCNVLARAAPVRPRFMRDRLERSLRKLGKLHAVQVSDTGWQALRDGFEARP
jgi:3-deoxy-D-manno-octulosonic acid kinase